ncbi:uncharacterized protein HMPREF1541_10195 [Cyphellophora europaea CBS 101466]|uniref:FAD-binding domain-containing protein n=1 Tax=Cyphellophora europaea (strain CBS 101466) TaxID=1220924 RepID=W2S7C3_CYPE1|nr:uncharacterized protein HMPREF1541_10195 [Cyphellophora europaea CBS 101466]ETN44525.1 hypothetical protein HMPREF1541_10195 [Cyphellophora europaea CBS 101466]
MATPPPRAIIVGAGITGLLLAQALKKRSIPFVIYERDPTADHRGKGWGITIHWALDALLSLLPQHIIDRLPEAYVDPEASRNGDNGNFLFFNLRTGEALWKVPPNKRIRMAREKFRRLLMEGIDIQWSHTLQDFHHSPNGVTATFTTPSNPQHSITAPLLIGADGSRSAVRRALFPGSLSANTPLPVRLLGVSTVYPAALSLTARALDPFFYQAGDPATDAFHWFSFLDSPSSNDRQGEAAAGHDCQILVSWPFRAGFLGDDEKPTEVPVGNVERVRLMKRVARGWAQPFAGIVQAIPEEAECKSIALEDWVPPLAGDRGWEAREGAGRVVLVGDAAHAMTMFRGEAANHGIVDVQVLVREVGSLLEGQDELVFERERELEEACRRYRREMVKRTRPAVLNSRQACLDAHVYERINDESPLIKRRIAVAEE